METTTSRDGTTIAFDRHGKGPAIVVVDGATAHRMINPIGAQLGELLGTQFTVIHYDRRGRGDSGDTLPYAVEREIEDLQAVIAAAGGSAFLLGFSSGGVLALDAVAHGLAVPKVAVYEPPFIVDDTRPPLPADYVAHLDELVADGRRGDAVEHFMTQAVGMPAEFVGPMREQPFWPVLEGVAHTIAYDGRIMGDTMSGDPKTLSRWTSSVTVPTLVLDGGNSPAVMHSGADTLAAALSDADRTTLAGQDHQASPDVLAPVLSEFFSR